MEWDKSYGSATTVLALFIFHADLAGGGRFLTLFFPESEFVNLLRSPGIDSKPDGPVRHPYLTYRPARLHRLSESIPGLLKRLHIVLRVFLLRWERVRKFL